MSTDKSIPNEKSVEDTATFARTYYEHQYDRIAQLEQHRLTISNIVLGVSLIGFTLAFSGGQRINVITGIGLPFMVIAINIFAILYLRNSAAVIMQHRERAKRVLELYAKDMYQIDQTTQWRGGRFGIPHLMFQEYIHAFLILIALLPLLVYLNVIPFS
jgi:hypothetical protein